MTEYHNTAKIAKILGVSERRVQQYCNEGRLGVRLGRYWYATDAQIERFKAKPRKVGRPAT